MSELVEYLTTPRSRVCRAHDRRRDAAYEFEPTSAPDLSRARAPAAGPNRRRSTCRSCIHESSGDRRTVPIDDVMRYPEAGRSLTTSPRVVGRAHAGRGASRGAHLLP